MVSVMLKLFNYIYVKSDALKIKINLLNYNLKTNCDKLGKYFSTIRFYIKRHSSIQKISK